ncbi:MFS transporter [Amnibacterium sp. CER49]|uniref:MFS transporter n=1 Tax=Amnibacterium sp. CER49 TaxID=3039161 RepID=UPI002447503F|nr:MFS transporter [Amnibacterium sp. CER49]MDH2444933.1 MFS transporter [Amnibacterium sp. CER49]
MRERAGLPALLGAAVVSTAGTRVSQIAVPWLVLTSTHDAVLTGLVGTAEITPYVVLQALGAPVVDRLGARRVALAGNLVAGAAMGLIPLLHAMAALPVPLLLGLVLVAGAARGPADAATQVLIPATARRSGTPLERATGLVDGAERLAGVLGAALAGALIAVLGAAPVVTIDAVSFGVGALLLLAVPRVDAVAGGAGVRGYLRDVGEGLRFVAAHPLTRSVAGMVLFTNFADAAVGGLLLLVWARATGVGTPGLGIVSAVFGIGAVAGATAFAAIGARLPRRRTFAVAFLVAGAPRLLALALPLPFWTVLVVWGVGGLFAGALNPLLATAQYSAIPEHLLARALAAVNAVAWAGIPLGALVAGLVVERVGLVPTLTGFALLYLVVTLDPFVRRSWRAMDREPAPAPA